MSRLVEELPAFVGFEQEQLAQVAKASTRLLAAPEGLARTLKAIRRGIGERMRETAYVLACEIAVVDRCIQPEELKMVRLLRRELRIEPLTAAAIERSTRARFAKVWVAVH